MTILSFGFNKINVEKKTKKNSGSLKIKQGMNISSVKGSDMVKDSKQKAYVIKFTFQTIYEPDFAKIDLEGELILLVNDKISKELDASWKKNKSLPKSVAVTVFNRILHTSNVESLLLSREVNLPPPMKMPNVNVKEAPAKKKAKK